MSPPPTSTGTRRPRALPETVVDAAAAMAGERDALERAATSPELSRLIERQRVAALVVRRAESAGIRGPNLELWQSHRRAVAAHWLVTEHMLGIAGEALAGAGVPWAPIKGGDLAVRAYDVLEDRPVSDLDLLVLPEHLTLAVDALKGAGWADRWGEDPEMVRYALEEGYVWPLVRREGVMIEVHFRLWGWTPEGLGDAMLRDAPLDPRLGATGHRLVAHDALILAACHAWTETSGEPPLRTLYDIVRLIDHAPELGTPDGISALITTCRRAGLLGAVSAVLLLCGHLWPRSWSASIGDGVLGAAGPVERAVARRLWPRIGHRSALAVLVAMRIVHGHPSRKGWRSITRRVIAHPGVRRLEREVPGVFR